MAAAGTAGPRRRALLAAAGLVLPLAASGCKGIAALATPPKPRPDVTVLAEAIDAEDLMVLRYQAVTARFPALAGPLGPLLAQHRDHLSRLHARLIPGAVPVPHATTPARPPAIPGTATATVSYLRQAEDGQARFLAGRLTGIPPSLAQLFASISASESTHAALLARGRIG